MPANPFAQAREMIVDVRQAFKQNVNSITWMDELTKLAVSEKVSLT